MVKVRPERTEKATLGGGCFWCIEAVYERIPGVVEAVSGYAGGTAPHPTYEEVSSGKTGHAEVVQVEYDPSVVSYEQILEVFWKSHDPTTPNRQGADVGTQYRSVILFHNEEQKKSAELSRRKLSESKAYSKPIVTEILPLGAFAAAEEYHQGYYDRNSSAGYCSFVIAPKLRKLHLQSSPLTTTR